MRYARIGIGVLAAHLGCTESDLHVVNTPPLAEVAPIEVPLRHYSNISIPVAGTIWDREQAIDELSAWLETNDDGVVGHVIPNEDGIVLGEVTLREGIHELRLVALDPLGETGEDAVLVEVGGPNSPPQCSLEAPESGSVFARDTDVEMWGTASDIDVGPEWLHSQWISDVDGLLWEGSPSTQGLTGWITDSLSAGPHTITLVVTDDAGTSCSDSTEISVGLPPTISWLSPEEGATITQGNAEALLVEIADPEDPPEELSLAWHSSVEGDFASGSGNSEGWAAAAGAALSLGEHLISVTVTDTDGSSANTSRTVHVVASPNAPDVVITPRDPQTLDDLRAFAWGSVDPEGDPVTYTFSWRESTSTDPVGSEQVLDHAFTSRREVWIVTATPWDSHGPGFPGTASITIGNTAPAVLQIDFDPESPASNAAVTALVSTTDVDGDSVESTYEWEVDGEPITTVTGNTLDGYLYFTRGQEIVVTATPDDGTDIGLPFRSDPIIAGNAPPEPPTIYVDPVSPEVGIDDILCVIDTEGSDADGDLLSYVFRWEADGVPYFDAGETHWPGDTVDADDLAYDEAWDCIVHAFDGMDYSDEAFASANTEGAIPTWCEPETRGGIDYIVCENLMEWGEAQEICESVDMNLIVIDSASEQSWLEGLVSDDVWIGYTDTDAETIWTWLHTGSGYENWASGQPDDDGGQDCAMARTGGGGKWYDESCTETYDFVCETP